MKKLFNQYELVSYLPEFVLDMVGISSIGLFFAWIGQDKVNKIIYDDTEGTFTFHYSRFFFSNEFYKVSKSQMKILKFNKEKSIIEIITPNIKFNITTKNNGFTR